MNGETELGDLRPVMADTTSGLEELEDIMQGSATLPSDAGVVFNWPGIDPFWMTYTNAPLDVAFVDAQWKVTEVTSMRRPLEQRAQPPPPYRLTIAANQGFFEKANIRPGNKAVVVLSP
jgi:uncharacterized membrane protein (UPF0127 family)